MKRHDSFGQCFAINREPKISATAALIYSLQPAAGASARRRRFDHAQSHHDRGDRDGAGMGARP